MEQTVDIVKLIEQNPITRLSANNQGKFANKIKSKFTGQDKQLFFASVFCYLNYDCKNDFIINLDDIWKWIGFTRKGHAKRLLIKLFVKDVDYKILFPHLDNKNLENQDLENQDLENQDLENQDLENQDLDDQDFDENIENENLDDKNTEMELQKKVKYGGYNKEKILISINSFKKLCLRANTSRSEEIHDYYILLEEILCQTIDEEMIELRNKLSTSNEKLLLKDSQHNKELKMKKHNTLIELLRTKRCVYLYEIKENDLIKIGSSGEVDHRGKRLTDVYGGSFFLEIFECQHFREIEANILKDKTIMQHLYRQPIKHDGSVSFEVVKLTEDFTYTDLITIVKKHVETDNKLFISPEQLLEKQKFDIESQIELRKLDIEKRKIDMEIQKLDMERQKSEYNFLLSLANNEKYSNVILEKIKEFSSTQHKLTKNKEFELDENEMNLIEIKPIETMKFESTEPVKTIPESTLIAIESVNKNAKSAQGRKIQKIDPKDITKVIKVYDSMIYLLRCPEHETYKRFNIIDAADNNTIYQGYRWCFVEKGDDPNVSKAKPTVEKEEYKIDVILQLNETKTKVIKFYTTKVSLLTELGITKIRLNKIIDEKIKHNNSYYIYRKDCPEALLKDIDYCPTTRTIKTATAKRIQQINPITGSKVIFNGFEELQLKIGIKRETIQKTIKNNTLYGGNIYQYCE
ncbi:putative glycosyltransferase [Bodo saltans virus]|uniref:Glycosyltransferase n=1 Tax=Bodo saltans virus TaxID=2024608 RepID=A0A2H4UUZ1_9VIRU|nr:putative glycosyltransferase [Bodo saltans virus]ATZ80743.1 putative glycosyltransferase [Bodo saltans virus]